MREAGRAVVAVIAVALIATAFAVTPFSSWTTAAQGKPVKIKYLPIPGGDYRIDAAHSVIGFSIRHYEISWVSGRFKDFKGTIRYDDKDVSKSSVEFNAKVTSIDTGIERRDGHLRTADFFDVAKFPEMVFKSTSVKRKGKNQYILEGDFTLKGVTKRISFPFTLTGAIKDAQGNTRTGIAAQTKIDRRDYGITWGKAMDNGGMDVGNEVVIDLQLEAVKPAAK